MIAGFVDWASEQFLGLDPEVQNELASFAGKLIKIECLGAGPTFYCQPTLRGLQVLSATEQKPDAVIRGTPLSLAVMGLNQKFSWIPKPKDVDIEGDAELVHALILLMKKYRIDWEELLAQCVGDRVAQTVGSQCRAMSEYGDDLRQRIQTNAVDYLQEELRLLPSSEEVSDFMADVDELRDRVERLVLHAK